MLGRLKFEIDELVNEMLDQLPEEVFKSKTTTFLDPCMGGGQFVKEVEARLRKYGHSDANIAKRVFGVESSELRVKYAVEKHGLVGQYFVHENYLEYGETMKFDVVIGNPPYQGINEKREHKARDKNLWVDFTSKAFSLVTNNGYLLFLTPTKWAGQDSGKRKKVDYSVFTTNHISKAHFLDEAERQRFFKGVGTYFSWFLIEKGSKKSKTALLINGEWVLTDITPGRYFPVVINSMSVAIHQKLCRYSILPWRKNFENHSQAMSENKLWSDKKSSQFTFPTWFSHKGPKFSSKKSTIYSQPKVIVDMLSTIQNAWFVPEGNCTENTQFLEVSSPKQGKNVLKLFQTKLYRYIAKAYRSGRGQGTVLANCPEVDLSRTWTDEELYKHFNLTKEEIEYIEANIK